jgi:hypothetical protein
VERGGNEEGNAEEAYGEEGEGAVGRGADARDEASVREAGQKARAKEGLDQVHLTFRRARPPAGPSAFPGFPPTTVFTTLAS